MKIAVIDDERPSRSELIHLIHSVRPELEICEADSGQKAVELATQEEFAVFFVDINLGDMSGTTLSLMLRKLQPKACIVFATAYDEYAVKAFDMEATDYILKPFEPARVERALSRALSQSAQEPKRMEDPAKWGRLTIASEKRTIVLDLASIQYIETAGRGCIIHTAGEQHTSTQPIGYFEKKLAGQQFLRVHKSFLVNLAQVVEITPWMGGLCSLRLQGEGLQLPVGRKQVRLLREIFEIQ